jgi:hypothetical protein
MISFLSGAAVAVVLAIGTYVAMTTLYVPTEVRYAGDGNLHLGEELIEAEVTPE